MHAWITEQNPMDFIQQINVNPSCAETEIFLSHYADTVVALGPVRAASADVALTAYTR